MSSSDTAAEAAAFLSPTGPRRADGASANYEQTHTQTSSEPPVGPWSSELHCMGMGKWIKLV